MGYRKRVGLAQAIVHKPSLIVLDEPISDLDPMQIIEMRNLILSLKNEHTILISSHMLGEVSQTADRYIFLKSGEIIAEENKQTLLDKKVTLEEVFIQYN